MKINLYPNGILKINLYLIFALLASNLVAIFLRHYANDAYMLDLGKLFDFNHEKNIPTLYSTLALLLASALLAMIATMHKRMHQSYLPWWILSFIFLFLSFDEILTIHERFAEPTREALNTTGFLYYAWIIPYGIALLVFLMAYAKFLFKLPRETMIMFIVSGALFVGGAIGFEMLGGKQASESGSHTVSYAIFYTFEELFEMIGVALFIYTLLAYIVKQFDTLVINIGINEFKNQTSTR